MQRTAGTLAGLVLAVAGALACDNKTTGPRADRADMTLARLHVLPIPLESLLLQAGAIAAPLTEVHIPTYDGSGQTVHPSVVVLDTPWNGARCWAAITPYPFGSAVYENASIYTCDDPTHWVEPAGIRNPILRGVFYRQNNSDPDLAFDSTARMLVFTNRFSSDDSNIVTRWRSRDGVVWGDTMRLVPEHSHRIVSPSETRGPRVPVMFSVNTGADGCKSRHNAVEVREALNASVAPPSQYVYGPPAPTVYAQPHFIVWHQETRWVPALQRFISLSAEFPDSTPGAYGCLDDELWLKTSRDGVHFVAYPLPILLRDNVWEHVASWYRASFVYDPARDVLRVWVSAADLNATPAWHTFYIEYHWTALIACLEDLLNAGGFQSAQYVGLTRPNLRARRVLARLAAAP